jgi:putative FmdB family regulatory protein
MPVYEYFCETCGHTKEVMQKISDPALTRCDRCSGRLKKLISQSTFQLKGTGWYVTDYASKNRSTPSGTDKAKDSEPEKAAKTPEKAAEKQADA